MVVVVVGCFVFFLFSFVVVMTVTIAIFAPMPYGCCRQRLLSQFVFVQD